MERRIPRGWRSEIEQGTAFGLRAEAALASPAARTRTPSVSQRAYREPVGTAMAARISAILNIKAGKGCGCKSFADEMDKWGIIGCENNRHIIVNRLVAQRESLIEALADGAAQQALVSGAISAIDKTLKMANILKNWVRGCDHVEDGEDGVLVRGANWLLDKAIEDVKAMPAIINRRKPKAPHGNAVHKAKPITSEQNRLYRETISAKPPESDLFVGDPVIHLGCHLWPLNTASGDESPWRWHVEEWNAIADTIKGRCIVGLVLGDEPISGTKSATYETVREALSDRFEIITSQNTGEGENTTFRMLQEALPNGPDDILIYVHGKGVRPHTATLQSVRIWTEIMYQTVTWNHSEIISKMSQGYEVVGSIRTFGNFTHPLRNKWHFSGTFFAVRLKHVKGKPVKAVYGGVEGWPGEYFTTDKSWCVFGDNQPLLGGYDLEYIYPKIIDQQMQWEVDRLGGPRCEQHKRELDWFLTNIKEDDKILVIGSKHGGLEHQIKKEHPGIGLVSIDISPQPDNTQFVIIGSSTDIDIQEEARKLGPFDIVFIDGDHSLMGVSKDWEFAKTLNPRIIAFHDIAKAVKHDREGCEVDQLWSLVKKEFRTDELIVGCGWGGIGIVHMTIPTSV